MSNLLNNTFLIKNLYKEISSDLVDRTVCACDEGSLSIVGSCAFVQCTSLTSVSFPVCTRISSCAFQSCTSLTSVDFPACTTIGNYAFSGCTSLTSVSFPVCTSISEAAFCRCTSLTSVSFPVCTTIGNYAFSRCTSLTSVNFPACTKINGRAFYGCSSLISVYLTGSSVVSLANVNAFQYSPMSVSTYTGSFGSIFVPASLVSAYQSATNWSKYSARIVGGIVFTVDGKTYYADEGMTWLEFIRSAYNSEGEFSINSSNSLTYNGKLVYTSSGGTYSVDYVVNSGNHTTTDPGSVD